MVYKTRIKLGLIILLLVGCASGGIIFADESNKNDTINGITYEFIVAKYCKGDIIIRYPQIVNLEDSGQRNKINKILKEDALAFLNNYDEIEIDSKLSLDIDFDIMWDGQRLLSVRFLGSGYLKGAAHPFNSFYTSNIDIVHGTRVKLKELVRIDNGFLLAFKQAKYRPWHPLLNLEEGGMLDEALYYTYDDKSLMESFNNTNLLDQSWAFWYLTEDSLGISLGISDLGNHLEFEMDYEDLRSNLITDNQLWRDFFSNM